MAKNKKIKGEYYKMKMNLQGNINKSELTKVVESALKEYMEQLGADNPEQVKQINELAEDMFITELSVTYGFKLKDSDEINHLTVDPFEMNEREMLTVECEINPDGTVGDIYSNEDGELYDKKQAEKKVLQK